MTVTIRPAAEQDIPSIRHILWTTWLDAYSAYVPTADLQSYFSDHYNEEALKHQLQKESIRCWIASCDSVDAGFVRTSHVPDEHRLYMQQLYILPEFQSHGLGKQLLTIASQQASSLGYQDLWFGVMVQNEPALAWYRRYGFQVVEESPFLFGSTRVDHYIGFIPVSTFVSPATDTLH